MDYPYPLTIIKDRYQGTYSGGKFTAWNLKHFDVPEAIQGDDLTASVFWQYDDFIVGKGDTPEEAILDLIEKLEARPLD